METFPSGGIPRSDHRCCVPTNFRCNMDVTGGFLSNSGPHFVDNQVLLYFDYVTQRTRTETGVILPNGGHLTHTEIADFAKHRVFKIDGSSCVESHMNASIQEQCISGDARLVSSGYVGSPKNPLNVQTWRFSIPGTDIINYRTLTETTPGKCIPVLQAEHGFLNGAYSAMTYIISDVHIGGASSSLFDSRPDTCHKVYPH
ncbi:uncharacterized protein LOC133174928 [Saccostrea echinata]|uniref:uncharacterized protein LOC133174928 n=1 Tax=Saccostrea echinata TaxID=191078 RepID=UPI002A840A29|nr:uncharacterized protein LOC133174928 [Saccostrea echinata]